MKIGWAQHAVILGCLLVMALDASRSPDIAEPVWQAAYFSVFVLFVAWLVTRRLGVLTWFYGALTVVSVVRFGVLVGDERYAGAAINILLVMFLSDFVRMHRNDAR